MEYWPWWIGALALGGVSLGYYLLIGKLLGVSGSWSKVVGWKEDRELARSARELEQADEGEIEDALLAATLAEFGAGAMDANDDTDGASDTSDDELSGGETRTPVIHPGRHI